jgi:hypothetical protein
MHDHDYCRVFQSIWRTQWHILYWILMQLGETGTAFDSQINSVAKLPFVFGNSHLYTDIDFAQIGAQTS